MSHNLIFIGGAPGVGKSTVAELLLNDLQDSIWLDGDDLWRMHPFEVDDTKKRMVERNICFVLNSFIHEHFSYIILTWVFHLDAIVDTILEGIDRADYTFSNYTLICDEQTLTKRISSDSRRKTNPSLAIKRLKASKGVNSIQLDTAGKTPSEIADIIKKQI